MAVSKSQYKIIKKAVIIRINRGEDVNDAIAAYPKLSDIQKADMLIELVDEGYVSAGYDVEQEDAEPVE